MLTKEQISKQIREGLIEKNLRIAGEDFNRPWGGFFRIADESLDEFLTVYFSGVKIPFDTAKLNLSPKILVVEPDKKLSWQVHERRSELWRVIKGPVGTYTSPTDEQPDKMDISEEDEVIEMNLGTRHRLVGLKDWGIIAEIWIHNDPEHPSDEDDIRRISDDFGR